MGADTTAISDVKQLTAIGALGLRAGESIAHRTDVPTITIPLGRFVTNVVLELNFFFARVWFSIAASTTISPRS